MKISKVEFWNSPMLWTIVLKTILKISRHAENHVKNFKTCWNIVFKMHYRFQHMLKFSFQHALQCVENHVQGLGRTAVKGMMWPWRDLLKTYFTELIQLKYKLILWIKTMGCCGLACVVWLKSCEFSKRKLVLIVGNSSMMCLLQKFLNLTYLWTFFIFYQTE